MNNNVTYCALDKLVYFRANGQKNRAKSANRGHS